MQKSIKLPPTSLYQFIFQYQIGLTLLTLFFAFQLPPVNVDRLINPDGNIARVHSSSGSLDVELPKSKKSHSDKRPSRPDAGRASRSNRTFLFDLN
jgi:hypothetical protein